MDVEPRVGRVLVFQQLGLWHSGEVVESGVKFTVRSDILYETLREDLVDVVSDGESGEDGEEDGLGEGGVEEWSM